LELNSFPGYLIRNFPFESPISTTPYSVAFALEIIARHPWGYVFPALALIGLAGMRNFNHPATAVRAFICSSPYMLGIAISTAFGLCPYVLPSTIDPKFSLSIYNAAAPKRSLHIGLLWFIPGIILAVIYLCVGYRTFAGKVELAANHASCVDLIAANCHSRRKFGLLGLRGIAD